jgi:hypothetical protein
MYRHVEVECGTVPGRSRPLRIYHTIHDLRYALPGIKLGLDELLVISWSVCSNRLCFIRLSLSSISPFQLKSRVTQVLLQERKGFPSQVTGDWFGILTALMTPLMHHRT